MWLIAAPFFALLFGSYAFSRVVKTRPVVEDAAQEELAEDCEVVVVTETVDAEDAVVSDVMEWLEEASERLEITTPVVMQLVGGSKLLKFSSKSTELNLWLSGEEYLGPFPRLSLAGNTKNAGISINRSALDLEKAVIELRP